MTRTSTLDQVRGAAGPPPPAQPPSPALPGATRTKTRVICGPLPYNKPRVSPFSLGQRGCRRHATSRRRTSWYPRPHSGTGLPALSCGFGISVLLVPTIHCHAFDSAFGPRRRPPVASDAAGCQRRAETCRSIQSVTPSNVTSRTPPEKRRRPDREPVTRRTLTLRTELCPAGAGRRQCRPGVSLRGTAATGDDSGPWAGPGPASAVARPAGQRSRHTPCGRLAVPKDQRTASPERLRARGSRLVPWDVSPTGTAAP